MRLGVQRAEQQSRASCAAFTFLRVDGMVPKSQEGWGRCRAKPGGGLPRWLKAGASLSCPKRPACVTPVTLLGGPVQVSSAGVPVAVETHDAFAMTPFFAAGSGTATVVAESIGGDIATQEVALP